MQHGKPHHVAGRDGQPESREGWAGRGEVADGPVRPMRLGNASGGKGPWFENSARRRAGTVIG